MLDNPLAADRPLILQVAEEGGAGGGGGGGEAALAGAPPAPAPAPSLSTALSAREWGRVRAALAQSPGIRGSVVGGDGKVQMPVGWGKREGAFVREADGRQAASIEEVLGLLVAGGAAQAK